MIKGGDLTRFTRFCLEALIFVGTDHERGFFFLDFCTVMTVMIIKMYAKDRLFGLIYESYGIIT